MFKLSILAITITLISSCAQVITKPHSTHSEQELEMLEEDTTNITPKEEMAQDEDKVISTPIEAGSFTHSHAFLKNTKNENVKFWIKYFSQTDKERFIRFHQNGERFRPLIESILEDHGLPKDLYFVGLIESGYYLGAKSHAGAVGPWQFIKATGQNYGLLVNNKVDERRNIIKATHAAARFFQDLYNIFGSWELALSAYNAGEYGIIRRIRNAKTRDFYELSAQQKLPKETIHYVPKIIAAMEVIKNAKQYGIPTHFKAEKIYSMAKPVRINRSIGLNQFANKHDIDLDVLKKLNTDLLTSEIPKTRQGLSVYVPSNKISRELVVLDEAQEEEMPEIVQTPAKRKIASVGRDNNNKKQTQKNYLKYKVKKGDNLYSIARRHNTAISKIVALNHLKKRSIFYGQVLKLPVVKKIFYTVKRGDYLNKIARQYGLSLNEIKALNAIEKEKVIPGQRLVVRIQ